MGRVARAVVGLCLFVSACDAQVDEQFRGEPLARLSGRITSEVAELPGDLAIAVAWQTEAGSGLLGTIVPVEAQFPAQYTVDLYRPPPAEQLHGKLDDSMLVAEGSLLLVDRGRLGDWEGGALPREAVVASVDTARRHVRLLYATAAGEANGLVLEAGYQVSIAEVVGDTDGPCSNTCIGDGSVEVSAAMACCLCSLELDHRMGSVAETSLDLAIERDFGWIDPWAIDNQPIHRVCDEELGGG